MSRPDDSAWAAAEAVRELNHQTLVHDSRDSFEWPSDVDAVIAALETLAQRLPQAINQASRWLVTAVDAGRVGHDEGRDAAGAVDEACEHLSGSADLATHLSYRLGLARAQTSHLTGRATGAQR